MAGLWNSKWLLLRHGPVPSVPPRSQLTTQGLRSLNQELKSMPPLSCRCQGSGLSDRKGLRQLVGKQEQARLALGCSVKGHGKGRQAPRQSAQGMAQATCYIHSARSHTYSTGWVACPRSLGPWIRTRNPCWAPEGPTRVFFPLRTLSTADWGGREHPEPSPHAAKDGEEETAAPGQGLAANLLQGHSKRPARWK